MRRWMSIVATLGAIACAALVLTPWALAAAVAPTVAAGPATAVRNTSVTLHGTVNPNGAATSYQFLWGVTPALGSSSPAAPAGVGAGTAATAVRVRLGDLNPDTTYYYELRASNSVGSSATPVQTIRTTGHPAPIATTEPATAVGRYAATLSGVIDTNDQATTYYFQYGLSPSYGLQTAPQTLAAGTAPAPVSARLPGIAPGVIFHYRLVASHGGKFTSFGADAVFQTLPWPRPRTHLTYRIRPRVTSNRPPIFNVSGHVIRPNVTTLTPGCRGSVRVRYYYGRRLLLTRYAPVAATCTYSIRIRVGGRLPRRARLKVALRYGGGPYGSASPVRTATVAVR